MTYKQYRFLKALNKITPEMNEEQKYSAQFIPTIMKKSKMTKEEVLTRAKELEEFGYVVVCKNGEDAERSGFVHLIGITYSGVDAKNSYIINKLLSILGNIIVPAIVSIICSYIVNKYFS